MAFPRNRNLLPTGTTVVPGAPPELDELPPPPIGEPPRVKGLKPPPAGGRPAAAKMSTAEIAKSKVKINFFIDTHIYSNVMIVKIAAYDNLKIVNAQIIQNNLWIGAINEKKVS